MKQKMKSYYVPQLIFKQLSLKLMFLKKSYPLINPYNVNNLVKSVDNLWIKFKNLRLKNEFICEYVDKFVYNSRLCTVYSLYKWIKENYPLIYKHVNKFYNIQKANDLCYKHLWITL